ncbi:hypothetical protein F5884DRAFT_816197 [Xylogone sp. PMI_703]|nr:hypothetical protein F5884DRAFT_816197 [Xylogone sp. PMI_703]
MPPRRSHKKSKAGCQRCKIRKIKCDEVHPECGNCQKHGVACDFSDPSVVPPLTSSHRERTNTPPTRLASAELDLGSTLQLYQKPGDIVRSTAAYSVSRALELRLMHHYTALTAKTLSNAPSQQNAWQVDIPSLAYDAQYLMDAILAVSALHLRALLPNDQILVQASHSYMASALAQYSELLNKGVTQYNAEALFSTAALIAFQSSASRRFEGQGDGFDTYALPLAWFHSFQGVKAIVFTSWEWLRNSDKVAPIINSQQPLTLDQDPDQTKFFTYLLDGIDEQLVFIEENLRADTKRSYEHAVSFLNWAHQRPERGTILGFAAIVTRRFVDLIGRKDPRTLVIVACFFAMTKAVDDVWWLQGVAKREIMGIFNLLPEEWWPMMDWPIRVANTEGPIDEETWGIPFRSGEVPKEEQINLRAHIDMLAQIMNASAPQEPVD